MRTPYTLSWTFGLQREITRDTAIEVRYVGNRTMQQWEQFNFNENNVTTNGWMEEFLNAQKNVYANLAAGRGKNFRYYGPGTGTVSATHHPQIPLAQQPGSEQFNELHHFRAWQRSGRIFHQLHV